jgi:transcription antitermination factor NusA-like protein
VTRVHVVDAAAREAQVIVPDYQLSLAIGKEGQNARLAARLTGWRIDIRSDAVAAAAPEPAPAEPAPAEPAPAELTSAEPAPAEPAPAEPAPAQPAREAAVPSSAQSAVPSSEA